MAQPMAAAMRAGEPQATTVHGREWLARCVELARVRGMEHRARYAQMDEFGRVVYTTPSGSDDYRVYTQWHDEARGGWRCTCAAGSYDHACAHVGAAIHAAEWRRRAIDDANRQSEAERNRDYWRAMAAAADDNAGHDFREYAY